VTRVAGLLVINPNTSADVSARLLRAAQAHPAATSVPVRVITARFGPRYITGELGAAVAGHAALDAYAAHVQAHGLPSAVLLGCFGDPGLFALRALSPVTVLGLAEAALRATAVGGPFVVVTGGPAWVPMLQRLADALALPAPMCGVHALARSGGELAADPQGAVPLLAQAAREALARWPQARQVLLGGAGLAGYAEPVAAELGRPVLCNVQLALNASFQAALSADLPRACRPEAGLEPGPWSGLSPELSSLLSAPAAG
jgi:allantoin racemase